MNGRTCSSGKNFDTEIANGVDNIDDTVNY